MSKRMNHRTVGKKKKKILKVYELSSTESGKK